MYSTSVFTYIPRRHVIVLSGNSARKYMPQYSAPLSIHKGVDTKLQYQFLNQEQKPVDVTGKLIKFRILNYDGTKILLEKALSSVLPVTGIMEVVVNAGDIENIPTQKAYYTLEIPQGQFDFPVYLDQNQGARGDLNIVNSILPSFVPSTYVTIPQDQLFPNTSSDMNTHTYNSSVINTGDNPILTIQIEYENYSGNVVIQGSTLVDSEWYTITSDNYNDANSTIGYTIDGFHPFVRIEFESNQGNIGNILVR